MMLILFWSVPALLPGLSLVLWAGRDRLPAEPGHAWLSMPRQFARVHDPLEGWSSWPEQALAPDPAPVAIPEALPVTKAPPVVGRRPFIVSGRIRMGLSDLYCFLNTDTGRWFYVAEGETEPLTGCRLEKGGPSMLNLVDRSGAVLLSFERDSGMGAAATKAGEEPE